MGAMRLCFLLFCLFFVSVSSVRKLKTIDELRKTGYGRLYPRHGLPLFFWFSQNVFVDQNNNNLINSNFPPNRGDFGFHQFGNREGILPRLISGHRYFSVGNLNYRNAYALPGYVQRNRNSFETQNVPQINMDRLIVSVHENTPYVISRVFITSHNLNMNDFNSSETFEIDHPLILQTRQTPCVPTEEEEEDRCRRFLQQTAYISNNCIFRSQKKRMPYSQCKTNDVIKLEIKTATEGKSKLIWEIPADIMEKYKYVYIYICQKATSSDTNEDCTKVKQLNNYESSGASETSVSLNAGLQPRLQLYTSFFNAHFTNPYIWYGSEFDGANKVIPIRIKGLDASLQLCAKDGKACARLYIKKTFSDWKNVLYYSWVGFYKSSQDKNEDYKEFKYAVYFEMIDNSNITNYDIYQYNSDLYIAPGVQIRLLLDKNYNNVLAQTTPWESDEKVTILPSNCDNGTLQAEFSSPWSYPEFFYEPEFYDANNVMPIKIQMFEAGLQLLTKNGRTCARIYIKKTFTEWKKTFHKSWVGFYTSSEKAIEKYTEYVYVLKFEKEVGTKNFDIYYTCATFPIGPGVQLRFLKDKGYDRKLVETEPWRSG